ncbi:MAG: MBL fold metallo-hydrolase [Ardenticatenaceae bacterium]
MALELRSCDVGDWGTHSYALVCSETNESVLIDPGNEPDKLTDMLGNSNATAIWVTHTHLDHVDALAEMKARLGVPVLARAGVRSGAISRQIEVDQPIDDGDTVYVGNHTVSVIYTPGHSDDMLCFMIENDDRVIVGDTIFEGGPGRTWSHEDFKTTLVTLRDIVLTWPDEKVLYPGHGPYFRLGDQRVAIEGFLAKDHGEFEGDAEWGM